MLKVIGLGLLLLSISLLSTFLSSVDFSKTGFEGFIGEGLQSDNVGGGGGGDDYNMYQNFVSDQGDVLGGGLDKNVEQNGGSSDGGYGGGIGGEGRGGGSGALSDFSNLRNPFNPPNVPLFFVEGLDENTNYLRLYTSSRFEDGTWIPDKLTCSSPSIPFQFRKFKVVPIVNLSYYLPVSKDTKAVVSLREKIYDCYDADKGVFTVKSAREVYYGFSTAKNITPTVFDGKIDPYRDPEIRELAESITANATSDYEKIEAIISYLKNNYINTYANTGIKEFLFEKKAGTAREFASAFVLLTQSLGIPSRIVFGYLANPTPNNQTIFASNAYVWAEVRFKEGWIEFDPSPKGVGIKTKTEITYSDTKIVAGENFTVEGKVTDIFGNPVKGYVEIFLKKDKKKDDGILIGIAKVNGTFKVVLKAPEVTGKYHIVAHYTGSKYHSESWSDPEVEIYYRPKVNVSLPDKVVRNFTLTGSIEADKPYNGYIKLCIDDSCRRLRVDDGHFETQVKLSRGQHEIKIKVPGNGFLLPVEYVRTVEAGDIKIAMNETVEEGENVTGVVMFNGEPVNATLIIDGIAIKAVNGSFSGKVPLNLGKNELSIYIPDFLYEDKKTLYSKRKVEIEVHRQEDVMEVIVRDYSGNPADGFVELNGVRKDLKEGVAEFQLPKDFKGGILIYSGSEKYFPAVKELDDDFLAFVPALVALAALVATILIAYYFYRKLWKEGEIKIRAEKEYPGLPDVWDVGETVRIHLDEPAFVRVDGYIDFTDTIELSFNDYGVKKIVAEKRDGKIKKKGELLIKIMPYSEGIAEILRKLEKVAEKRIENVESLTGREIMERLNIKAPVLLNYFEHGKYGKRKYGRKEFLEAFEDYLRVVGNESEDI